MVILIQWSKSPLSVCPVNASQLGLLGTAYSTGRLQHNTDFAKTNQNEVVWIRTNFFEDFWIHKLICENEFVILNL